MLKQMKFHHSVTSSKSSIIPEKIMLTESNNDNVCNHIRKREDSTIHEINVTNNIREDVV